MSPDTVAVLIIVLILAIIGFDIYLALDKEEDNTFSSIIRAAGKKWVPLIIMASFGMGLLAGHWWW